MEEDAEKMAALKKAYADIIFNTAKESAERILVAERRALGFQQSLSAAKEEALATILRLKAIMEDKIRGAEKAAHSQEKKIEELELQLGEAEDTIVDLREELKRVREELTMMKDVSDQPLSDANTNDSDKIEKEASTYNLDKPANITMSQKIADTHQFHLQNAAIADFSKDFSMWKSKVPELYRNGYTQRIHALEQNSPFKSDSLKSGKTLEPGEDHVKFFNKASPKKQRALYNQLNSLSCGIFSDKYKSWASSSMLTVHDKQNENEATSASVPASTEIDEIIEETSKKDMGIKHCTERLTWESIQKKQNLSVCDNELTQTFLHEDVKDPACRSIEKDLVDRIEVAVASREEVENEAENPENFVAVEPGTKDKFLKYTFQRKRKRECSPIKSDVEFPEKKTTSKPKPVDKQTSLSVPLKSSVVTDLPRNNRRVVQVARQLISLSEKRW